MKLYKLYAYKLVNGKKIDVEIVGVHAKNSIGLRIKYRKFLLNQNIDFDGIDIVNYGKIGRKTINECIRYIEKYSR